MDDIKLPEFPDLDTSEDLDTGGLFDDLLPDQSSAPSAPTIAPTQNLTAQPDLFADIIGDTSSASRPDQYNDQIQREVGAGNDNQIGRVRSAVGSLAQSTARSLTSEVKHSALSAVKNSYSVLDIADAIDRGEDTAPLESELFRGHGAGYATLGIADAMEGAHELGKGALRAGARLVDSKLGTDMANAGAIAPEEDYANGLLEDVRGSIYQSWLKKYKAASPEERARMKSIVQEKLPGLGEYAPENLPADDARNNPVGFAHFAADKVQEGVESAAPVNPEYRDEFFAGQLPDAAGFTAGLALQGLAARKLSPAQIKNVATVMSTAHAGGSGNAVQSFEEALHNGASLSDAYKAFGYGYGIGTSEALPIANFFDRLDKVSGGGVKRLLTDVAKQAAEEGIQEVSQTVLNNLVAGEVVKYDPKRGMLTGAGDAFAAGVSVGTAMEFIGEMLTGFRRLRHRAGGPPLTQEELQIQAKGVGGNITEVQGRLVSAEKSMAATRKRYEQAAAAGAGVDELQQFEDDLAELENEIGSLKSQQSGLREQAKSLDQEVEASFAAGAQQQAPVDQSPQWSVDAEYDLRDAFQKGLEEPAVDGSLDFGGAPAGATDAIPFSKVEVPDIKIPDFGLQDMDGGIDYQTPAVRDTSKMDALAAKFNEYLNAEIDKRVQEKLPKGAPVEQASRLLRDRYVNGIVRMKDALERQPKSSRTVVNPRLDSLMVAIAKYGGLNREEAIKEGFDPADMKQRYDGVWAFPKEGGLGFDAMGERLQQDGYISSEYMVNDLMDKVDHAVRGNDVFSNAMDPQMRAVATALKRLSEKEAVGSAVTPEHALKALDTALSGGALTTRQSRIVSRFLDSIADEHVDNMDPAKREALEQRLSRIKEIASQRAKEGKELTLADVKPFVFRPVEKHETPEEALLGDLLEAATIQKLLPREELEAKLKQYDYAVHKFTAFLQGLGLSHDYLQRSQDAAHIAAGQGNARAPDEGSPYDDIQWPEEGHSTSTQSPFSEEETGLESYSEVDLRQRDAETASRQQAENKQRESVEAKAKADSEAKDFVLSGSDLPADQAAARGQNDLFGASKKPSTVATENEGVEHYQWQPNADGGQTVGNKQTIQPLAEREYDRYIKNLVDGKPSFAEYQKKHPDVTHINLVDKGGKIIPGFPAVGSLEKLRPKTENFNNGWVIKVDDFNSSAAVKQSATPDSAPKKSAPDDLSKWFGDSKVVGSDGKPLMVYHGTSEEFTDFAEEFYGESTGVGDLGEGFYFTDKPETAASFAGEGNGSNIRPVYLSFQNPAGNKEFLLPEVQAAIDDGMGFTTPQEVLKGMGFDSMIFTHRDGQKEYLAFSSDQIRTAIGVDTASMGKKEIDRAAHEAATSPKNDLPQPTDAQKEAGNYKKGHITLQGLDITIENPKDSYRTGTSPDGKAWKNKLHSHYGYIKKTEGADGDHVDVFVGDNPESNLVFIVDQVDKSRKFDEHKVMLGFPNKERAIKGYMDNYERGWHVGPVSKLTMDEFKEWLKGDTTKPYSKNVEVPAKEEKQRQASTGQTRIDDLGEKIGGARKDTAAPVGPRGKRSSDDDMPTWRKRFVVVQNVLNKEGVYSPDEGKWQVIDKKTSRAVRGVGEFNTEAEAEKMLPVIAVGIKHRAAPAKGGEKYSIYRDVTDRKRVKIVQQDFDNRMDAMKYMAEHAAEILETKTSFGEEILPAPEKVYRAGAERRKGDVVDKDFMSAFGFRGVEFGNWNNQAERQEVMNHAYDGLMDLAEVLNIPAKALSLNGELALAFGARGQGLSGAKAHYEPSYAVINLTKMSGAGSLAHEWFHGLDHYLSRRDGTSPTDKVDGARGGKVYKDGTFFSHGFNWKEGVRQELRDAYDGLIKTMFRKAEQYVEDTQKADKFVADSRESLQKALDGLRRGLAEQRDPTYWKKHNKPATAEQLAAFDELAAKLVSGQDLATKYRPNDAENTESRLRRGAISGRYTNDTLEAISHILKSVRGRTGFNAERKGALDNLRGYMSRYEQRINMLKSAEASETKTKHVPTSYAMEAKEADQGRASDYWTTPHEMAARAFAAYVEDKISERGGTSEFLVYRAHGAVLAPTEKGVFYPYPEGKERIAVNAAFDKFFETLEHAKTESGVELKEKGTNYEISDAAGRAYSAGQSESQGDLFSAAHLPRKSADLQRLANVNVRVHHVATGKIKVGINKINSPEDAAHVFAAMRKHAQETFMVLVTNESGAIVALQRYSKGSKSIATINIAEVVASVASVAPGKTKHVWFSHNHPSGDPTPSNADSQSTKRMQDAMAWSDEIVYRGHMVVSMNGASEWIKPDGSIESLKAKPAPRSQDVEWTERMYAINSTAKATEINRPEDAKEILKNLPGESGALLLDNRHRAVGYVEIPADMVRADAVKNSPIGSAILRAVDQTNAASVVLRGAHDEGLAAGIAKIFADIEVRTLDYVTDSGTSYAEKGLMENLPRFKRVSTAGGTGVTSEEAQRVIKQFREQYKGIAPLKFYLFGTKEEAYGRENLRRAGMDEKHKIKGAYEAGSVHLILEDHNDTADLLKTLRHEVWTHHGLSMLNEVDRKRVLVASESARLYSQELRDIWTQIKQDYPDSNYETRNEELIARVAELYGDAIHAKAQSKFHGAVSKLLNAITDMLRKIGFLGPRDGVDQLIDILVDRAAALKKPVKNPVKQGGAEARGLLFNQNDRLAITTERLKQYPSASLFTAIAKHGENFRYQKSDARDYKSILEGMMPKKGRSDETIEFVVTKNTESKEEHGAEPTFKVEIVNDGIVNATIKQWQIKGTNKHFVEIDSSRGTDGMTIYQAAFTWAHNNGQVLVPDPGGVSDMNLLRRMEAAISSTLRFGTTRHFQNQPESYMALLPEHQYDALDPMSSRQKIIDKDGNLTAYGQSKEGNDEGVRAREALDSLYQEVWKDESKIDRNDKKAVDTYFHNLQNMITASQNLVMQRSEKVREYDKQQAQKNAGRTAQGLAGLVGSIDSGLEKAPLDLTETDYRAGVGALSARRALFSSLLERLVRQSRNFDHLDGFLQGLSEADVQHAKAELGFSDQRHLLSAEELLSYTDTGLTSVDGTKRKPLLYRVDGDKPVVIATASSDGRGMRFKQLRSSLTPQIKQAAIHGISVQVVADIDGLPDGFDVDPKASMIRHDKTLYLVSSNITRPSDVRRLLEKTVKRISAGDKESSLVDDINKAMRGEGIQSIAHLKDRVMEVTHRQKLAFVARRHLADFGTRLVPGIRRYVMIAQRMDADRNDLLAESAELAEKWRGYLKREPEAAQKLAELMHDTTVAGVDPSKAYIPLTNAEETQEKIRRERSLIRSNSAEENQKRFANIDAAKNLLGQEKNREKARDEIQKSWNALPAEAKALYEEVRDSYVVQRKRLFDALEDRIKDSIANEKSRKELIDKLRRAFESNTVQEPYFPLQRFGQYWVRVKGAKDKDGNYATDEFTMFETEREWKEYTDHLRSQGLNVAAGKKIEKMLSQGGVDPSFVVDVDTTLSKLHGPQIDDIRDKIYQLYLHTLPDLTVRKHFIHRKKTEGYSRDAIRAYAHNMFHGSYQLARLRWSYKLETILKQMDMAQDLASDDDKLEEYRQEVEAGKADPIVLRDAEAAQKDLAKSADLISEMYQRHDWAMNPKGGWLANNISSVGFAWYLGLTPAAALVNTTQVPLVAFPMLGAKFGFGPAAAELQKAYKDYFKGGANSEGFFSISKSLEGEELEAYHRFVRDGVIDKTMAHDLAGLSEEGSQHSDNMHRFMKVVSWAFHKAEVSNREIVAMATYRLARQKGFNHVKAMRQAGEIVWDSQFDYSSGNKARIMQGDVAKVALMFKQYSLNMTYLLYRTAYNASPLQKNISPAEKSEARKRMAAIIGMHWLFAGALGILPQPFYPVIKALLESLMGDDDEPVDLDVEIRILAANLFGKTGGSIVTSGVVNAATGADVAGRISLSQLMWRDPGKELEGKELFSHWVEQILGPAVGIFASAAEGFPMLFKDGYFVRGAEKMLPKALRDVLKTYRYTEEGVKSMRGDPVLSDPSPLQLFWQLIGFTPAQLAERYDENAIVKRAEAAIIDRRRALIDRYAVSFRLGDKDLRQETLEEIKRYNKAHPEYPVDGGTLLRSLQSRAKYSQRADQGVIVNPHLVEKLERYDFAD